MIMRNRLGSIDLQVQSVLALFTGNPRPSNRTTLLDLSIRLSHTKPFLEGNGTARFYIQIEFYFYLKDIRFEIHSPVACSKRIPGEISKIQNYTMMTACCTTMLLEALADAADLLPFYSSRCILDGFQKLVRAQSSKYHFR